MSMELYVALPTRDPITVETLVESSRQLGIELAFDAEVVFEKAGGFQPGALAGEQTGVEIDFFEPEYEPEVTELFDGALSPLARIVAFRWGGDYMEGAFALAVAAALVAGHDGICFDPQEGMILSVEQLVEFTHGMVVEAREAAVKST
ncbi:hypothetical protein DWF00_21380 [Bosea caraganae]|uniref:Uncharacterized protein n=1 Tax=Bosea caraganae TaxID=2763117 RepID=A0A370L6B1_9HYPH|nr:hypothetical protein [Bosea caraganae]RDJ23198.1 hypothetical protein DWF00_21380 [Bosea caraganae]RDJ24688.1 hypothetical protein DWE98_13515 [Bosea caraganae]